MTFALVHLVYIISFIMKSYC